MASSNFKTEKMLKIRIVRGTVQSPTATFTAGDDVEVEEGLARHWQKLRLALIHGEDDLTGGAEDSFETTRAMLGENETRDIVAGVR